ncbi:hypothetical protein Y032_0037g3370 [Ancylostoma ceylanicum]|uniref:Integrase catalytic domain-containing protein n=2 Tax=Ancylostoma ceylanicum TaxID=53326 RepID=A0A016UKZ2_9BILA|nr:hypothetical protein Y032_0037g3370 [Ancylostoma ceylanicum]
MDEIKIDDIMDALEKQIEAKKYVESRLRNFTKFDHPKKRSDNMQREFATTNTKSCVFCKIPNHESINCKTVTDVQARRNTVKEEKLCWKCFSSEHISNHCAKPNCTRCGRMHDISLCFPTSNIAERHSNQRVAPSNRHSSYQRPQVRSEEGEDMRTNRPPWRNNHSNDARDRMNRRHTVNNTCLETGANNSPQITRNLEQIVLMTAEGNVWNHKTNQFEKVLFFFDTGAQKSLIRESTADDFGLVSQQTEHCTMSGIGGHTERFKSNLVTLRVSTAFGKQINLTVHTKPIITNGFSSVRLSEEDKHFLQFKEMFICNPRVRGEHQNPHILIGLDYYYELVPPNTTTVQTPSGLQITNTVFGPSIHGKGALLAASTNEGTAMHGLALIEEIDEIESEESTIHQLTVINDSNESQILEKMFELEGLGISQEELQKDESTFSYFQSYSKKLSFENGIATAPLPLKDNVIDLSDNYSVAYRRLMSLWQQLQMNDQQRTWYSRVLEKYVQENVIEEAKNDIPNNVGTYYMPHSGVWRPSKAVPLRIVFDASSKRKSCFSLNDVIYTGETFVNKIHDLLISSRLSEIILLCDIEAAFTQIRLHHTHKDLCRFLWVKNPDKPPTRDNIIEYRFTRLPFGLTASPSILNMVILAYLNQKDTPLAREIASHLYVDNILLKAKNAEEAIAKYRESKAIFAEIGMNLREYISNSRTVNSAIPENDRLEGKVIKFLGVKYDVEKDEYALDIHIPTKERLTKRDIVSQLNSVYDPIGIAGPLLVKLKSLMRDIYSTKTDWKETIPHHLAQKWNETCQQINNTSITLPRKALRGHDCDDRRHTLWVFSDASKMAIATSAYLQSERSREVTQLISGKTRLTPKKITQTIPRLELLGILIAMRLAKTITSTLRDSIKNVKIASDSEIALAWVPSTRKLPPFVSSQRDRIARLKIHLESEGVHVQFYHVPTDKNPADAGTRGLTGETILEHDWIRGPRWLTVDPKNWPLKVITAASAGTDDDYSAETQAYVTVSPPADSNDEEKFINLSHFSKYTKVLRTMATIGKLSNRWTRKCQFYSEEKFATIKEFDTQNEITAHDINHGERLLIASIHRSTSLQELQKRFHNMKIIQDEYGIIRHESRIQNAVLPHDTKSPIYIPNPSDLARLILTHIHYNNAHCGNDQTLALARQRFWIPQPMKAIKKYVKGCAICKRCHGLPYGAPEMPPLPNDRVIISKPFQKIGCDFLGPFESNNQEKMYVCLYTCLTTRAVHLEAVENLSAGAFLNCFIRFVSRRGVPQLVRTDCGTNFKLGQKIIDKLFEKDEQHENSVMTYSATERIRWIFNPPGAPWMGGVWERLVGSVKRSFTKAVGRKKLTFTELNTVIARIEAIINTRPLTKMSSSEINDIPLRPIDFLQGNVKYALPSPTTDANDPEYDPELIQTAAQAKEAMHYSEITSTKFWDRWNSEYLTLLRDSQRRHLNQPRHTTSTPRIGEIVIIEQDLIPRGNWVYGKILSLIPSADGLIRSAKILMPNQKVLQRPLNKIFPLEISSGPETENEEPREQSEQLPSSTAENVEHNEMVNATQPAEMNTSKNRRNPERASKTRAYEVIQNFERSLESAAAIRTIAAHTGQR